MNILISYYSFTGNTRKLAYRISDYLKEKGNSVELQELKPEKETGKFLFQAITAFTKKNVILPANLKYDLACYEVIFLCSPVWAFSPAPAITSYLLNCQNLSGKFFYLFVTYGSGIGRFRCLNIMQRLVEKKGGEVLAKFDIKDERVNDLSYLKNMLLAHSQII